MRHIGSTYYVTVQTGSRYSTLAQSDSSVLGYLPIAEPSASGVDIDLRDWGSERLSDRDIRGSVDLHMCIEGMLRIGRAL